MCQQLVLEHFGIIFIVLWEFPQSPLTKKPLQAKPATVLSYYLILSNLIIMLKRVERGQGKGVLKCFPLNV